MHQAPFTGSPLFWHLSPSDPRLLLAHTSGKVMLMHLCDAQIGQVTTVLEADIASSCQVAHLVDGNRSFVVASGRQLLVLSVKERDAIESAAVLQEARENPQSSSVLLEFGPGEGMVLFQTTPDDCVVAGVIEDIFFRELYDVNIATRAKTKIACEIALGFFLSPPSNNRRFVLMLAFDGQVREKFVSKRCVFFVIGFCKRISCGLFTTEFRDSKRPWNRKSQGKKERQI